MALLFRLRRRDLRMPPPVFVPGVLASGIIRAVEAVLSPLVMAGPEIEKRLRPHAERLFDIPSPTRAERLGRAAILWLIGSPETEPEPTEADLRQHSAWQAAARGLWVHPQGTQTPTSADQDTGEGSRPTGDPILQPAPPEVPANTVPGVR